MDELTSQLDAQTAGILTDLVKLGLDRKDGHVFNAYLIAAAQNVAATVPSVGALSPDVFAEKVWFQVAALIKAGIATKAAAAKVL